GGPRDADVVAWKQRFRRLFAREGADPGTEGFDRAFYDADDALVGAIPAGLSFAETVTRLAPTGAHSGACSRANGAAPGARGSRAPRRARGGASRRGVVSRGGARRARPQRRGS